MTLFDRLRDAATNPAHLEKFIAHNTEEILDWFNLEPHSFLKEHKRDIKNFIQQKWNVIRHVNVGDNNNLAFLTLLLDVTERLGDLSNFVRLYDLLRRTNFSIGSRLQAASLYMIRVQQDEDYINRYDAIYKLLKKAYIDEEDTVDRLIATMINYYSQVVHNFGGSMPATSRALKHKIEQTIKNDEFSFLNHSLMFEVLETDLSDHQIAYSHIHLQLDTFLNRATHHPAAKIGVLKETDTFYSEELINVDVEFGAIRAISVRRHQENPNRDIDRANLLSGTKIVDDENQLFAYMYSLGPMHHEKLVSAFPLVPLNGIGQPVGIVDWGCGQGAGSMALLNHILQGDLNLNIESITLIEPSELALKRASLHTDKFDDTTRLLTINKLLGNLTTDDFNAREEVTIHLFSNILDIEAISLKSLTDLIKATFQGTNYFICVGPYQNDMKRVRFDTFMNSFAQNNLHLLGRANNRAYEWIGTKQWTRVLRVFVAEL